MSGEEAIALNDIAFEIADDSKGSNIIYVDDITGTDDSWKDKRIKKLEEQVEHKDNLLGFFKKETKTKVFDNRKLRKALQDADKLLENLCDQITADYNAKNDVISSLLKETNEKDTIVKELNEVIANKDWSRINEFEENKKELDDLRNLIQDKDDMISKQLVKIITEDAEMEKQNERINVLEQKIFKQDGEKIRMAKEQEENSLKLKQLEQQIQQLQEHNHALEDDIIQIENPKKKKKCWLPKCFRKSSSQNKNNNNNNNNNNKSSKRTIRGYFSRKLSLQTQTTLDNNDDFIGQTSQ